MVAMNYESKCIEGRGDSWYSTWILIREHIAREAREQNGNTITIYVSELKNMINVQWF